MNPGSSRYNDEKTNQWNDITSRRHARKKCKVQTSTGEVVVSVFGGSEGILLVKLHRYHHNPERYEQTLISENNEFAGFSHKGSSIN
jgi:hypothetical protein